MCRQMNKFPLSFSSLKWQLPLGPIEPDKSILWIEDIHSYSKDFFLKTRPVILIVVTRSCHGHKALKRKHLPFHTYSRLIFRRHISYLVLKIAFRSVQIEECSAGGYPPPYKARAFRTRECLAPPPPKKKTCSYVADTRFQCALLPDILLQSDP